MAACCNNDVSDFNRTSCIPQGFFDVQFYTKRVFLKLFVELKCDFLWQQEHEFHLKMQRLAFGEREIEQVAHF